MNPHDEIQRLADVAGRALQPFNAELRRQHDAIGELRRITDMPGTRALLDAVKSETALFRQLTEAVRMDGAFEHLRAEMRQQQEDSRFRERLGFALVGIRPRPVVVNIIVVNPSEGQSS